MRWRYGSWSQCTSTCGGGEQARQGLCEDGDGQVVEDQHCDHLVRVTRRECGQQDCPRWSTGDWSACSVTCGQGVSHRPYSCQQGGQAVETILCDSNSVPEHKQSCWRDECSGWLAEDWTLCSVDCGEGVKSRHVVCVTEESKKQLPEEMCKLDEKPASSKPCIEKSCAESENNEDNSIAIHGSNQIHQHGVKLNETINRAIQRNDVSIRTQKIYLGKGVRLPRYRWKVGHWSKCSVICGGGHQTRFIACFDRVKGKMEQEEGKCGQVRARPKDKQSCAASDCLVGKWLKGEWSACSATCGKVSYTFIISIQFNCQVSIQFDQHQLVFAEVYKTLHYFLASSHKCNFTVDNIL